MTMEDKLARIMRDSGPARMLLPAGIALIVFGIILMFFKTDHFVETTGKITAVDVVMGDQDARQYDVAFAYQVDGRDYEGIFGNLSGQYAVGDDIAVYYDPDMPEKTSNNKTSGLLAPLLLAAGAAALGLGIYQSRDAVKKSRALDERAAGGAAQADFRDFKNAPGVTEYYFRYDGDALKPGYLLEDGDRKALFEGKTLKNALVGARTFEFTDHTAGSVREHEVGHTATTAYNDEFFSVSSWFKFDGENIWDVLHGRGLRMSTDLHSQFPSLIYDVTRDGAAFARIESTSIYVHEDDEAQHKLAVPMGKRYYRCWTASRDFETLFLTMFAVSESEQAVAE